MAYPPRPASDKQLYWINKLAPEKALLDWQRAELASDLNKAVFSTKDASFWLDTLFALPNIPAAPAPGAVTEEGFYAHDGDIYRVVRTKDGQRHYAKKVTAHGFDFDAAKGVFRHLRADAKLTPEQVLAYGVTTGICAECSTLLSDPVSVHVGIGPTCGPRVLGKDAHKVLVKQAKLVPHVAEALAVIKARKDAEKAAAAAQAEQLELV